MTTENAILSKLLALHDAGHFDLPSELLNRRDAEARMIAAARDVDLALRNANPAAVRSRIVAAIVDAAGNGELPKGYVEPFLTEQDKLRRLSAEQSILAEARTQLTERTPYVAMRLSETILSDYLRPAMEAALEPVREGAVVASRVPWSDSRALVRAEAEVREYHELVAVAAEKYRAIRDAQWRVKALAGQPSDDAFRIFGELRNMPEIWPQRGSWVQTIRGEAPWPEDGLERMVWLVTSPAVVWMPTAGECTAAYEAIVEANPLGRGGVVAGERR